MAVDTREKRASAIGHYYTVLPLPDAAAETAADRAQVSWVYSAFGALAVAATVGTIVAEAASLGSIAAQADDLGSLVGNASGATLLGS